MKWQNIRFLINIFFITFLLSIKSAYSTSENIAYHAIWYKNQEIDYSLSLDLDKPQRFIHRLSFVKFYTKQAFDDFNESEVQEFIVFKKFEGSNETIVIKEPQNVNNYYSRFIPTNTWSNSIGHYVIEHKTVNNCIIDIEIRFFLLQSEALNYYHLKNNQSKNVWYVNSITNFSNQLMQMYLNPSCIYKHSIKKCKSSNDSSFVFNSNNFLKLFIENAENLDLNIISNANLISNCNTLIESMNICSQVSIPTNVDNKSYFLLPINYDRCTYFINSLFKEMYICSINEKPILTIQSINTLNTNYIPITNCILGKKPYYLFVTDFP